MIAMLMDRRMGTATVGCHNVVKEMIMKDEWTQEIRRHYNQCSNKCANFLCKCHDPWKVERILCVNSWKIEMEVVMAPDEMYDLLKKEKQSTITSFCKSSISPPSHTLHIDHHVYWPLTYILSCFVNLVPLTPFFLQDLNFLHCSFTICKIFQECNQHEQQGLAVFQQLQVLLESNCPSVVTWMCWDILCGKILLSSTTVSRNLCCHWQD